jgi:hypothetical protein
MIGTISISSNHQERSGSTLQSGDKDNSNGHILLSPDEIEELQREVEKIYLSHLENLINGDYHYLLDSFSEDYIEPTDRFVNQKPKLDENYFKRYYSSEIYQEYKGKELEDLIFTDRFINLETFDSSKNYSSKFGFSLYGKYTELKDGDVLICYYSKGNTSFIDWEVLYRKQNGEWNIIASNFWSANERYLGILED